MAQIICRDLAIGYEGKTVVQNINLSVKKGDYLCVIGENGAGKSTFMKTLLGLLPPVSGKIEFHDGLKKNEIGYLPQQTEVQKDFPASVREIVLSGCQNHLGFWPFYRTKEKKIRRRDDEKNCRSLICQNVATENCPEGNSREFCLQEHFVRPGKFCFWMNRFPGWIHK